jgi:hypothetical protein
MHLHTSPTRIAQAWNLFRMKYAPTATNTKELLEQINRQLYREEIQTEDLIPVAQYQRDFYRQSLPFITTASYTLCPNLPVWVEFYYGLPINQSTFFGSILQFHLYDLNLAINTLKPLVAPPHLDFYLINLTEMRHRGARMDAVYGHQSVATLYREQYKSLLTGLRYQAETVRTMEAMKEFIAVRNHLRELNEQLE